MAKLIPLLFVLVFFAFNASGQKKAANALSENDFDRAASAFKEFTDDNLFDPLANYGLALVYQDSANTKKNLSIAYRYIRIAARNVDKMPADKLKNAEKFYPGFLQKVSSLNTIIDSLLTVEVFKKSELSQVIRFQAECSDSKHISMINDLRTRLEFELAKKTNTIQAYNDFLARFPTAKETRNAISARDNLAFDKIKETTLLPLFNEFIETYQSDSQLVNAAIKLRDKAAYKTYKDYYKHNDIDNLTHFLLYFPNAEDKDIKDIIQLKNKLEFREAKSINTIEAYQTYIFRHPGFPEVEEAITIRDSLVFDDVKKRNEADPYFNQFLSTIPFAKEAMELFMKNYRCFNSPESVNKDRISLAFDLAMCRNTKQALNEFIDKYPKAEKEVNLAKERIRILDEGN